VRALHHVGYWVEDLDSAMKQWSRDLGVGPFNVIEHVPFDSFVLAAGGQEHRDVVFDHSAAFAAWGPVVVELCQLAGQQVDRAADARDAQRVEEVRLVGVDRRGRAGIGSQLSSRGRFGSFSVTAQAGPSPRCPVTTSQYRANSDGAPGSSHPPRRANQCGEVKWLYVTTGAMPAARQ